MTDDTKKFVERQRELAKLVASIRNEVEKAERALQICRHTGVEEAIAYVSHIVDGFEYRADYS